MDIYEKIFDNIPIALALCDKDFNIIRANEAFRLFEQKNLEEKELKEFIKSKSSFKFEIKDIEDKKLVYVENLQDINETHSDFVSTVSHELRTPLTSIRGFADTLLKSSDKLDESQKTRFASIIKDQADRLSRLVENLLAVSKIESQKDTNILKPVNLNTVVYDVLEILKPKYPSHNFELKIPEKTSEIWADADKLHRVLFNLIENAAKYSLENSTVTLNAEESKDNIKIKIIDQGVGIPQDCLESIFTRFSRVDNPLTRKVQGSGLGLYITKSLVLQMNGKIKVENNPQGGAIFEVELPAATEDKYQQKFLQSKE